jgi:hypothetical protein
MTTHQLIGSTRTFVADDGVTWSVGEYVDGEGDDDADDAHCLVFSSESAIRRIRGFPADWRGCDQDTLLSLSWMR